MNLYLFENKLPQFHLIRNKLNENENKDRALSRGNATNELRLRTNKKTIEKLKSQHPSIHFISLNCNEHIKNPNNFKTEAHWNLCVSPSRVILSQNVSKEKSFWHVSILYRWTHAYCVCSYIRSYIHTFTWCLVVCELSNSMDLIIKNTTEVQRQTFQ